MKTKADADSYDGGSCWQFSAAWRHQLRTDKAVYGSVLGTVTTHRAQRLQIQK